MEQKIFALKNQKNFLKIKSFDPAGPTLLNLPDRTVALFIHWAMWRDELNLTVFMHFASLRFARKWFSCLVYKNVFKRGPKISKKPSKIRNFDLL